MMSNHFGLLCCCVVVFCASVSKSSLPFNKFSTKTAYEWAHNISDFKENQLVSIQVPGHVCTASHVSFVARHGTRYPGDDDMIEIGELYNKIKTTMDFGANPTFRNWTNPFHVSKESMLATMGEEEHEGLGERTAIRLMSLLQNKKNMSDFTFLSSRKGRSKQSAVFFHQGFTNATGIPISNDATFEPKVNDTLLRFYETCKRYGQEVDDNPDAMKEVEKFKKGVRILQVRDRMATKLGVDANLLEPDDVELIYNICPFETEIFNSSPWCSLLEDQDLPILAYLGDLEEYYDYGYAYDINWKQSCPLLSRLFGNMKDSIKKMENVDTNQIVSGEFAFGHAGTMVPIMTALGLFNDSVPLKADNFDAQANRQFRTSKNICFSSNIMFVLYECASNAGDNQHVFYLKVLVNEAPVVLPACGDYQCPFETVVNYYSDLVNCQYEKLCEVNGAMSSNIMNYGVYYSLTFVLITVLLGFNSE